MLLFKKPEFLVPFIDYDLHELLFASEYSWPVLILYFLDLGGCSWDYGIELV